MNTERIISHTKYRLAGLLASVALLAAGCTADEDTDAPYLYFGEEIESLSYTVNGGSLTVEMYSNMGPWVIEPAYTGDEEWIDIWPDEGDDSGRFTVTVAANDGAYTRSTSSSAAGSSSPSRSCSRASIRRSPSTWAPTIS